MVQFQQQIGASLDDTFARVGFNYPYRYYANFGRNYIGKGLVYVNAFLRFLLNIPKGSTINSAYLTLHAYETRTNDFTAQINYTNEDDAEAFSTDGASIYPYDRTDGGTDVAWIVPDFTACQTLQTIDIKSLIQGFIDRAGYNENNHIAIRIKHGDAELTPEYQSFYQYDGNPANAAILTINYTPPAAPVGYSYSDGLVSIQVGG